MTSIVMEKQVRAYQDAKKAGKRYHILGKQATLFASLC
jgi:hypothetical protein